MHSFAKSSLAGFTLSAFLVNQIHAYMPQIGFEAPDYISGSSLGAIQVPGWSLLAGSAKVSPAGTGFEGGQALKLEVNPNQEAFLKRSVDWNPDEKIAFIDLRIKPAADPQGSYASFYANGTQIAFQVPLGGQAGEIWVYNGGGGNANAARWAKTVGTFALATDGLTASDYTRITLRHDYQRNIWDLFIGSKLVAANLVFEGRGANLEEIELYGSKVGDTLIDDLAASTTNMLFADTDKDGLPNDWETANGSNPNLYDRNAIKPGTGKSFLDHYMDSLWLGGLNGNTALPAQGSIPPISIIGSHQPVASLKGSLSVGGDGTASYSLPIDIPKGTAGMEPKISLGYSSGAGNGIAGLGWSLGGLQTITRGASSAAKDGAYDPMDFDVDALEGTKDRFFLNGERLVCITGKYGAAGSVYRTEIDSFARITAVGAGPASWKVETKAGLIMYLGETADSRTSVAQGTLSWGVNRVLDTLGNYYDVTYARDAATADYDFVNHRVSSIRYTGNATHNLSPYCSLQFTYEERPDVSGSYTTHAGYRSTKRLTKIRVLTGNYVNHSYRLGYETSYQSGRSLLKSIAKHAEDNDTLGIPATTFNYDGLKELNSNGTPTQLWRDPGNTSVPVYGGGLDATGEVNSVVNTETDGTLIRLTGDVARAYRLATPVAVNADTRISFQFKSSRQVSGALIGLDSNLSYEGQSSSQLYRIGGTGTITMAGGVNYSDANSTLPYAIAEDWKTFDLNIGSMGIGTKGYLVFMCVDNNVDDGVDNAVFRDVTIYQPGNPPIAGMSPIIFNIEAELPRYADAAGKDLGIVAADLNSDGLVDLADWRAISYTTNSNSTLVPNTAGSVYRNTGGDFVPSTILRPPATLPLGCRSSDTEANDYNTKFHLLAQPMDVDGDGRTDLMGSINIQNHSGGRLKNDYAFYTLINNVWTEKTEWRLPFSIENTYPGARRDEHFQWVDLNTDGYQDLVIHTSAYGRLIDSAGTVILGPNAGTAYLNKGKNGPGWTRDDSYALPLPLMYNGADIGIRILDLDGDGKPDISKSRHQNGAGFVRKTFTLKKSGTPRWDPPTEDGIGSLEYYFLPSGLVLSSGNPGETLLLDLNGDGLVDIVKDIEACWLNRGKGIVNPTNGYNEPWKWRPPASATVDQADTYHFPIRCFLKAGHPVLTLAFPTASSLPTSMGTASWTSFTRISITPRRPDPTMSLS
jgi:hypothetical protein